MPGVVNRVAGGRRPPSRNDTSLVVSSGVDCGRRRNVYDKNPLRYAKDNRTAHLTARSDKSVAYVTNNKKLYSTFCTVEANYWQIRSIARPLCDSRATCFHSHAFNETFIVNGNLNAVMALLLTSCLQCCKQRIFSKNTSYFYAVKISISLAILSKIFIQIGYFF